jgi:HPt (histidine-containing phosphotransfer) domain-containing protein
MVSNHRRAAGQALLHIPTPPVAEQNHFDNHPQQHVPPDHAPPTVPPPPNKVGEREVAGKAGTEAGTKDEISASPPSFDEEAYQQFLAMMGDAASALIAIFLEDVPKNIEAIQEGYRREDVPTVTRAAHSIKSSSAQVGAMGFSSLCKDIEMVGHNGTLEGVGGLIEQLESEYERVQAWLVEHERQQ